MIKQIDEKEFVGKFFTLMAEVECGDHFDPSNASHTKWVRKRIAIHYFRGTCFYAYYLDDKTPIGFVAVLIDKGLEDVQCFGQYTELLDIAIFPKYQGKGYGTKLLKHAETVSREADAYCMYISTTATNYDIIAFYGKNGFVPVATMPDVHGPNEEGNVWMRKILK